MGQEYQWADALRKAKHQATQSQKTVERSFEPTTKDITPQLQEQMAYYKTKLKEALASGKASSIELLVHRIIGIHAQLTAQCIKTEKENGETDASEEVQNHLKKYFSDGALLLGMIPPKT